MIEDVKDNYTEIGSGPSFPFVCQEELLNRFEILSNKIAAGWKYHVSNTPGITEAWFKFQDFYMAICSGGTHKFGNSTDTTPSAGSTLHPSDSSAKHERLSPEECQKRLFQMIGALYSPLSANWRYQITHAPEIAEAWQNFEYFFVKTCSFDLCESNIHI
ncbi:hypothetical protein AB6A40_007637 [Gnathostoma spinigerum]|uniref:Uncharacterized protein n=1 Tax=Gnathostoma spinigerum TaxID=75299 RepID=A0ABD6EM26_9BILA